MQNKALVAFATVLIMMLAAFPLGVAESAPAGAEFSAGWYWESNELNKDKYVEAYGDEGVDELGYQFLYSMAITDSRLWNVSMEECSVKERDAFFTSIYSYDDSDDYIERWYQYSYSLTGHVKLVLTPDSSSIGSKLFNQSHITVTGTLAEDIKSAVIDKDTKIVIDCDDMYFALGRSLNDTFILNQNGSYIDIATDGTAINYLWFKNADISYTNSTGTVVLDSSMREDTSYSSSSSVYAADDPSEKGMKNVKVGDTILDNYVIHNSWVEWGAGLKTGEGDAVKKAYIVIDYDTSYRGSGVESKVYDTSFFKKETLESWEHLYGWYYYGMGGDVQKTESFLKSNGHFEKGYESGKYHSEVMYNEYNDDEGYAKYIEKIYSKGSSNDNTMLYVVSAIAVVLLIALIALAVMYKKKTA